jgi:hypothetical protein
MVNKTEAFNGFGFFSPGHYAPPSGALIDLQHADL